MNNENKTNEYLNSMESTAIVNLRDFDSVPKELYEFLFDNEKQDIISLKKTLEKRIF
jgi:hypothetical protein